MHHRKTSIQREQLYVVGRAERGVQIGADLHPTVPWDLLRSCHLYALDAEVLKRLLEDAAIHGYQICDGSVSDRRGMGGFSVCIGPHGVDGKVHCRKIDSWAIEIDSVEGLPEDVDQVCGFLQEAIRDLCHRLNEEAVGFRSTAIGFLRGLYERYGKPLEPDESFPPPLPEKVAKLCRRAHVGGPVVHARTTLEPYVRIDRSRAYGEAMLSDMPSGVPVHVEDPMTRWKQGRLGKMIGIVDALVRVEQGPCVPLLPVLRWSAAFDRSKTIYATGQIRGAFVLEELTALEEAGLGEVEQIYDAFVFEKSRALAPVVRWVRKLEPDLRHLVTSKRLEHVLYGNQSRSLSFRRFGSVPSYREPVLQDLLDSRGLERVKSAVSIWKMPIRTDPSLPLWEARGNYGFVAPNGVLDRPDRAAVVTARNRIEVGRMIRWLDDKLEAERSGEHVGRILVDGMDVEASREDLGALPEGWSIKDEGRKICIHRQNTTVATSLDGQIQIDDGGLFEEREAASVERLLHVLSFTADPEGGPLASGRYWPSVPGVEDPRLVEKIRSEPIDFAPGAFEGIGFSE